MDLQRMVQSKYLETGRDCNEGKWGKGKSYLQGEDQEQRNKLGKFQVCVVDQKTSRILNNVRVQEREWQKNRLKVDHAQF